MKKPLLFITRTFFTSIKANLLYATCIALLLSLSTAPKYSHAEGTKQLEPMGENPVLQLALYCLNYTGTNGWRNPFAIEGCDPEYRLNVHIKDPTSEVIYFGFRNTNASGPLYFQLRDPNGNIAIPWTEVPTVPSPGYIDTWDEAFNGPDLGAMTSGYTPLTYTPSIDGDFYFEFAADAFGTT
ncbi:MAG TPA: hypothetical protein PLP88_10385, partial [Bacteroidales bacterium]|nr:hypothetical protein [Bacteroidales bacterium]